MVGVAQLVERWLVVPEVAGSSPVIHPNTSPAGDTALLERLDVPWILIVWNDPINLMNYVVHVFRSYFGFPLEEAERLMMLVHNEGRAVVANGPREEMERHAHAMHEYGLQATIAREDA